MARKLLKEILGDENLKNMTPTGRGSRKPIPSIVCSAVFGKVFF